MMLQRCKGLALDASVLISLLPTGRMGDVLRALSVRIVVAEQAFREVYFDPSDRLQNVDILVPFVNSGILERVSLVEDVLEEAQNLAAGPVPEDLGDGEAATIAYAVAHGLDVVIDDKKARGVCRRRFEHVTIHSTVDLLRSAQVLSELGLDGLGEAVFSALAKGRMRVLHEDERWVRELIGPERAALCPSLRRRK